MIVWRKIYSIEYWRSSDKLQFEESGLTKSMNNYSTIKMRTNWYWIYSTWRNQLRQICLWMLSISWVRTWRMVSKLSSSWCLISKSRLGNRKWTWCIKLQFRWSHSFKIRPISCCTTTSSSVKCWLRRYLSLLRMHKQWKSGRSFKKMINLTT